MTGSGGDCGIDRFCGARSKSVKKLKNAQLYVNLKRKAQSLIGRQWYAVTMLVAKHPPH